MIRWQGTNGANGFLRSADPTEAKIGVSVAAVRCEEQNRYLIVEILRLAQSICLYTSQLGRKESF